MAGRITYRRVAKALLLALSLFVAGLIVYGACLRATAKALINSAKEIRTTADAEREIAAWRGRHLVTFDDELVGPGGDKQYSVLVLNTLLSKLRIIQPRMLAMTILMRSGMLRLVWLDLVDGSMAISIMEWFIPDSSMRFHVHPHRPWSAVVEFSADLPDRQRNKAFAFNASCLVKPWDCDKAEDILPGVWQLEAASK